MVFFEKFFFFLEALCFMSICKHCTSGIKPEDLESSLRAWEQKTKKKARSDFGCTLLTTREQLYLFTFWTIQSYLLQSVPFLHVGS